MISYRAVLFKWEFFIQMRDAISQPSLDIKESYFSKNILFFYENLILLHFITWSSTHPLYPWLKVLDLKLLHFCILTFSHVAISCDSASLSGSLARPSGWQTDETYSLFQLRLPVQLEDGDVVVQRLWVVVVVDVGRGHSKGLSAGAAELLGQVVVTNSHVNGVTRTNEAGI